MNNNIPRVRVIFYPRMFTIGALLLCFAAGWVYFWFENTAPGLGELTQVSMPLTGPVEWSVPKPGEPVATLPVGGSTISPQVLDLCRVWNCRLPPNVARLRKGDMVRFWIFQGEVWQLVAGGETLLKYEDVRAARQQRERKSWYAPALLSALGFFFLACSVIGWRRHRREKWDGLELRL